MLQVPFLREFSSFFKIFGRDLRGKARFMSVFKDSGQKKEGVKGYLEEYDGRRATGSNP